MFYYNKHTNILEWREFRNKLTTWPDDIETVAQIWAKAPIINNYLAYDDTHKWPDAWTLINEAIYCDISVALGMFYTLYYSNYSEKDNMRIEHYNIQSEHTTLNLVNLEDGKYMLNYHTGRSVNNNTLEGLPSPTYIITAKELPIKN